MAIRKSVTSNVFRMASILGVFLLLVLQYIWFRNSYEMIEQDLMEKCKECLREAVNEELFIRINKSQMKFVISDKNKNDSSDKRLVFKKKISNIDDANLFLQEFVIKIGLKPSILEIDSIFQIKMRAIYGSVPLYKISIINDTIIPISSLEDKKNKNHNKISKTVNKLPSTSDSINNSVYDRVKNKLIIVRISPNQIVRLKVTKAVGNVLQKAQYILFFSILLVLLIVIIMIYQLRNIIQENRFVRFLKEYTSALTHDLKTPLNSVNMAATVLYNEPFPLSDEGKKEYYRICKDQSRNMLNDIDRILTVARSEQTSLSVNKKEILVKIYLEELANAFIKNNVHSKGLTIEVLCDPESLTVKLDPVQMVNVFNNLMDNAVKYSYNEVHILIRAMQKNNMVYISVQDNGMGIPANDLDAIFQQFNQGTVLDRKRMFGYGIGLTYVKEIVKAHGGSITVSSEENIGSTFTISLPD